MTATYDGPDDLDCAMYERIQFRFPPVGPLTREQTAEEEAYTRYQEESEREYKAEQAAGGRTICPECGHRSVTHRTVVTYGYAGHPGADYSDLAKCERCDYMDV